MTEGYFQIRNEPADLLFAGASRLAGVPEPDLAGVLRAAHDAVPEVTRTLAPFALRTTDDTGSSTRLAFSCLFAAALFPHAERTGITAMMASVLCDNTGHLDLPQIHPPASPQAGTSPVTDNSTSPNFDSYVSR